MSYHTAIIGTGPAGLTLAVGLARLGKKVLIVEKHRVGGDCTNVGCVPSKTLLSLAEKVTHGKAAPEKALPQTRERRDHLWREETEWLSKMDNVTLKFAEARFLNPTTLGLFRDSEPIEEVKAKHIVIASGARAARPPLPGLPADRYLTNDTLFELEMPPKHLGIVGAGFIGVEMATAFRGLGCRVSLVGPLLNRHEPEVRQLMATVLEDLGVELYQDWRGVGYRPEENALLLQSEGKTETSIAGVDKVLVAVGRQPNIDVNLDEAGVRYDKAGIVCDNNGYTGVGSIYALGDVTQKSHTTHAANHQGRRLVKHLLLPFLPTGGTYHYPNVVYSSPEVATVGPTLEELRETHYRGQVIKTVKIPLKSTDRAYTCHLEEGFVLLHAMRLTGRLLSASIVAPSAGEMLPLLTYAVNHKVSLYRLSNLVFAYPTLAEAIKKAADQFVFETLPSLPKEALTYLAYRWRHPSANSRSALP